MYLYQKHIKQTSKQTNTGFRDWGRHSMTSRRFPVADAARAFILTGGAGSVACHHQALLFGAFQSQRRTERSGWSLPRNTDYSEDITASPHRSPAAQSPVCFYKGRRGPFPAGKAQLRVPNKGLLRCLLEGRGRRWWRFRGKEGVVLGWAPVLSFVLKQFGLETSVSASFVEMSPPKLPRC